MTTRSMRCGFAAAVRHMGSQQILLLALVFGFHAPAQAVTLAVGATPGTFSVSPFGAATYQIPIELPPGVNGMKPKLALAYSSQAGDGPQGQGWSLSGLSAITRCPQTIAQDNAVHMPDLSSNDRFCLDGQRLILISGTYGKGGSSYHTEIESFQQVSANGSSSGAPTSFTVVDRGGITRTYSTVMLGGDGSTPLMWLITKITDKYQNYVSFQYNITPGQQPLYGGGTWQSIVQIDYGRSGNVPVGHVLFTYDNNQPGNFRSDATDRYFAHTYVAANVVAMTGITVESGNGAVLRNYTLSYNFNLSQNPNPSPTRLLSVQECSGADATGDGVGTCYSPTTFSYGGSDTNFNIGGDWFANGTPMPSYQVVDFDGDGLPDYIYSYNGTLYVLFGKDYGTPVALPSVPLAEGTTPGIGLGGAVAMDINGDGKQELFVLYFPHPGITPDPPVWMMLVQSGNSLALEAVPTTDGSQLQGCPNADPGCTGINAIAVDPSHRGQMGLLFTDAGKLYYYFNVGGVFAPTPAGTGLTYLGVNGAAPALTPVNFSGSGNTEVYVAGNGVVTWDPTLNSGSGGFKYEATGNFDDANSQVMFLDANGDGLSGALMVDGGYWFYFPNKGDGTGFLFSNTAQNSYCAQSPNGIDLTQIQTIDWFHDGRQELMVPVNGVWNLLQATPAGCVFTTTGVNLQAGQASSRLVDINGDGQPDMVYVSNNRTQFLYNASSPYVVNEITDGLGHRTDIGYVSTTQASHGAYVSGDVPTVISAPRIRAYTGPIYVVKDFAIDSGTFDSQGNAQQIFTYYIYGGAAVDTWGRGFLGFDKVEAINYNSDLYTTNTYRQDFPYTGLVDTSTKQVLNSTPVLKSSNLGALGTKVTCTGIGSTEPNCNLNSAPAVATTWVTSGQYVSTTTNSYKHDLDPYAGVFYPYTSSSQTTTYDLKSGTAYETVGTTSLYKSVATGTPIGADLMPYHVVVTTTDANDATDTATVTTDTTYADDPNAPQINIACPARPAVVSVTNSLGSNTAPPKSETFGYDANCFLTSDVRSIFDPAGVAPTRTLTKTYAPDGSGNPKSSTISGDGVTSRTTTTFYDSTERFPATIVNPLGQNSTLSYDDWGNKLTDTDANGNTVTYAYTALAQKKKQSGPQQNLYVSWGYSSSCSSNCAQHVAAVVTQTGSDGGTMVTQSDELGRTIRTIHTGFSGESILQDTQYDMLGRVTNASMPYKAGATLVCWDVKTYDVLNRVVTDSQPFKVQSGTCLTRVVTTDYSKFTTTNTAADTTGDTTVTQEVTQSVLNVLGKATTLVDAKQKSTLYAYDPWGNPTKVTPPDGISSAVSMTYDSDGSKLTMTDPDMGAWSYTYDALGELLTQTDAKGQMVTNTYDALGRVTRRNEPEGVTAWKYDIAYGAGIGKLAYALGPNGVWEGYAYDAYGETTDKMTVVNGQEYWVTTTYDGQGRASQVVYPYLSGINVNSKPVVPQTPSVTVSAGDASVFIVTWTVSQSGQIYHLYRTLASATAPADTDEIFAGPDGAFLDSTIKANGTYKWWLKACNGDSSVNNQQANCSGFATPVSLTVVLPPSTPGIPQVPGTSAQTSTSWVVSWLGSRSGDPADTDTITYQLQKSLDGGTTYTTVPGTATSGDGIVYSLNTTGNTDGSYVYQVRACATGVCSRYSAPSGAYTANIQPGQVTMNLPASYVAPAYNSNIPVTYNTPAINGGTGNVVYTITLVGTRQKTINGVTVTLPSYTVLGTSTTTTYNDTTDAGTDGTYTYEVQACDANNPTLCGPMSAQASISVIFPPVPPATFTITVPASDSHSSSWLVSWTAATLQNGGTAQLTYNVGEYLNGVRIATYSNLTANSMYSNINHSDGTYTYNVQVCSEDDVVLSGVKDCLPYGSQSSGYATVIAPAFPTNVSADTSSSLNGSFNVSWTEPGTAGRVTSYTGKVGEWDSEVQKYLWVDGHCNQSNGASTSCTAVPSTSGTLYVEIEACNTDLGVTACSSYSAPGGPTNVTIASAPTLSGAGHTPTGIEQMSWTAVPRAAYYQVSAEYNNSTNNTWTAWSVIKTTTSTSYTDVLNATYQWSYYYVQACDAAGCTPISNTVVGSYDPPAAPSLSGSGSGPFSLSWSAPAGASSFQLYRQNEKGGVWGAWALVYSGPATSYSAGAGFRVQASSFYVQACSVVGCGPQSNGVDLTNNLCGSSCTSSVQEPVRPLAIEPARLMAIAPAPSVPESHLQALQGPMKPLEKTPEFALQSQPAGLAVVEPLPALEQQSLASLTPPAAGVAEAIAPGLSARQAFFLAHAQMRSGVVREHHKKAPLLAAEWAGRIHRAPAIDPRLSMYPPLRKDSRVQAHFESLGGQLPGEVRNADCGVNDADSDCSEPLAPALMVGYVYNSVGYLAQVQKLDDTTGYPTKVLWQGNDADAMGHMDQEAFDLSCSGQTCSTSGQKFSLVNTFDPVSGVLEASTGTAVAAAINATYTWDGYNNLLSRNVSETVSTGSPSPALAETFTYDEINRLTSNSATVGSNTVDAGTYSYDFVGDIQAKGGYTAYHYTNAAQSLADGTICTAGHPHAVSDVTIPGGAVRYFCYDANGNLQEETGDVTRTLTWTSFNKPSHISSNGASEGFLYGPGHERLVTTLTKAAGGTVTTVDIDGLFESAHDSTSGYTYRHYVVVGDARVAVETLQANSSGQQTADTLSFYVHDEVGSVIAAVTENLDSTNQQMSLLSYDAWGKARPTAAGAGAYVTPVAGSSMNPTIAGQKEGFGGHENLDDVGLVEMEGRIYDPEIGRFLSPDPNVQFPDSSQGYNRYTYVNNNPLSLSDPTGYFQVFGGDLGGSGQDAGKIIGDVAPLLSLIPYCEGWCTAAAYAVSGYLESGGSWGAGLRAGAISIATSEAFSYVGDDSGWFSQNPTGAELFERSVVEGFVGGTSSSLSGGNFQDGFEGAFAGSMLSGEIGQIGGDRSDIRYFSPANMGLRMVVSAIAGGAVSKLTGGDFTTAAIMAAMQRRFNDDNAFSKTFGYAGNIQSIQTAAAAYNGSRELQLQQSDALSACDFACHQMNENIQLWLNVPAISLSFASGLGEFSPALVDGESILLSRVSLTLDISTTTMGLVADHSAGNVLTEGGTHLLSERLSKMAEHTSNPIMKASFIISSQAVGLYDTLRDYWHH